MFLFFLLINLIAGIQAYSLTHYKKDASKIHINVGYSTLFTGVSIPKPKTDLKPSKNFTSLKIPVENDKYLEAWLLEPEVVSKGIVLIFHGFGSEKSSMLDRAYVFLDMGYKTLLIDFSGAGGSYGIQTTLGYKEAENVKHAYDFVKNTLREKSIFLCGFSMGSVAIIKAQHDHNLNVKALILEAPYGRLIDAVKIRLGKISYIGIPFSYLITFWGGVLNGFNPFSMNPEEYIKNVSIPTLLLCGGKDPRIPVEESKRIFTNSASKEKEFKIFPDSYHHSYLKLYPQEWKNIVYNFLEKNNFK